MRIFYENIMLNEGARDNALSMFLPYLQKRGINMSISQLKQTLLNKFVSEAGMHSLSLNSNFYLLGVARYYFNGDLTTNKQLNILYPRVKDRFNPQVCQRLDTLVEILRNAYVDSVGTKWEQPEDFGSLTIQQLFRKYNAKINKALGLDVKPEPPVETPKISEDYTAGKNYTYEILYSYEDARKYNKATEPGAWCITYGKQHYDAYIKRLKIHYIVFKQNGYEKIPRRIGKGFTRNKPHDEYGNSLICVLQSNSSPNPIYITSRWNHGSSVDGTQGTEADHAYTTEEFLNIVGCDQSVLQRAFEQWKANSNNDEIKKKNMSAMRADKLNAMRQLKYAQMMINGGADPTKIDFIGLRPVFSNDSNNWTRDGLNQKGLFWVTVNVNENESFLTIMDRKMIMFDKYLVNLSNGYGYYNNYMCNFSEKYISFRKDNDTFLIYDRLRKQFLSLDGITAFKHGTSQFTSHYNSDGYKYGIVAMNGNQLALINLQTVKPVKARNGSPWFESIQPYDTRSETNSDYRGRVHLPILSIENKILRLVYDSASGEKYWYDTNSDSFVDTKTGIPEGFVPKQYQNYNKQPGTDYMTFIPEGKEEELFKTEFGNPRVPIVFKHVPSNTIFQIQGETMFLDFVREDDLIGFRTTNSEVAYYADLKRNKLLTIDGEPVTTKYRCAIDKDNMSGYYLISLSRWYKVEEGQFSGRVTYGNFYHKVLLYNPFTGEFYQDKKNSLDDAGYVFYWYGSGYVTPPGARNDWAGIQGKELAIAKGWLVKIPTAQGDLYHKTLVKKESTNKLGRIIREEIEKFLKNIN